MNEHNLLIFCLKDNVSISEYTEMVDWAYENIQSETVVEITENQIIEYQNRGLWGLFLKLPIIGYLDQVRGLANR